MDPNYFDEMEVADAQTSETTDLSSQLSALSSQPSAVSSPRIGIGIFDCSPWVAERLLRASIKTYKENAPELLPLLDFHYNGVTYRVGEFTRKPAIPGAEKPTVAEAASEAEELEAACTRKARYPFTAKKRSNKAATTAQLEKAAELRANGLSLDVLASLIGCSRQKLASDLSKLNNQ